MRPYMTYLPCNKSYRNRSVVVAENNRVAKSKCWQYTSSNKMWGNFSKLLILHISFTAVKINGGIGKGIGGIWNGKFQNVNIILLGAVWRVWRAWRAWRKRKLKPWPPNNFPNVPQKMFPPCPKKFFFCNQKWFDATLVYRFNECNRKSYNS